MRGKQSTGGGGRTDRAGSLCRWGRRTRTPSPPPATASAGARQSVYPGRGSTPSPSQEAFVAPPPTPSATPRLVFSSLMSVFVYPSLPFVSLIVQRTNTAVLDAYFCLPDARREITYICDKRLLRGVAAPKSVSRCRGLHCRGGIRDSNRLRRVSSLGVAELEPEAGNCAVLNRLSDCAHPSLGLRRYAARNSGHAQSSGSASAPQSYPACRR